MRVLWRNVACPASQPTRTLEQWSSLTLDMVQKALHDEKDKLIVWMKQLLDLYNVLAVQNDLHCARKDNNESTCRDIESHLTLITHIDKRIKLLKKIIEQKHFYMTHDFLYSPFRLLNQRDEFVVPMADAMILSRSRSLSLEHLNKTLLVHLSGNADPLHNVIPRFTRHNSTPSNSRITEKDFFVTNNNIHGYFGVDRAHTTCFISYEKSSRHNQLVNKIVKIISNLFVSNSDSEEKNISTNAVQYDNLMIVGHSLGGNLASHAANKLKELHPDIPIHIYTHNSPYSGARPFLYMTGVSTKNFITQQFKNMSESCNPLVWLRSLLVSLLLCVAHIACIPFCPILICCSRCVLPASRDFKNHTSLNIKDDDFITRPIKGTHRVLLSRPTGLLRKTTNHLLPIKYCHIRSPRSILFEYLDSLIKRNEGSLQIGLNIIYEHILDTYSVVPLPDGKKTQYYETYESLLSWMFSAERYGDTHDEVSLLCQIVEFVQRDKRCCRFGIFSKEDNLLTQLKQSMKELNVKTIRYFQAPHDRVIEKLKIVDLYQNDNPSTSATSATPLIPSVA